jgi:hypothetical protein
MTGKMTAAHLEALNDVARWLGWMPETYAAEMGTQMCDAMAAAREPIAEVAAHLAAQIEGADDAR